MLHLPYLVGALALTALTELVDEFLVKESVRTDTPESRTQPVNDPEPQTPSDPNRSVVRGVPVPDPIVKKPKPVPRPAQKKKDVNDDTNNIPFQQKKNTVPKNKDGNGNEPKPETKTTKETKTSNSGE